VEIRDFTHEEKAALVGLVEFLIESDQSASTEELAQVRSLENILGSDDYRALALEVDKQVSGEDGLRKFLTTIKRQEVRELILEKAIEAAIPEGIRGRESSMLNWLKSEWGVDINFPES